jgi:molybdopterin molybdotransferase
MISLEQARDHVARTIEPLPPVRTSLGQAVGSVLREDACAAEDLPPFDRSAMDGYAFAADDPSTRFKIIAEARPGLRPDFAIHPGECARIFTGAEIPAGATQVIKQEDVRAESGWMTPVTRRAARHIRHRGEDARKGGRLLQSGQLLTPAEIGLLATLGIVSPLVSPQIRVAHFSTGDELVDPAETPGPSQIRDSNSSLVRAFASTLGAEVTRQERIPDIAEALAESLSAAIAAGCNLLLIVGAYDFGRTALESLHFKIHFNSVNLRPGRPLVFATRDSHAAFVLPGNPLSHLAVLHCIVRVAFERMAGAAPRWRVLNARLTAPVDIGGDGRDTLWPARVDFADGEPIATPLRWQSSGDITGLAGLNAFIRFTVPALDTGARVPCILIHG